MSTTQSTVRNSEFEQMIASEPDEKLDYLAYADWLQANGEPVRGELIVKQIEADENPDDRQLAMEAAEQLELFLEQFGCLYSQLANRDVATWEWRWGFVREFRASESQAPYLQALLQEPIFLPVRSLDFTQVPISDLAPLAHFKSLEVLCLNETEVTDLSPLAGLIKLKQLELVETQISDLTPLARLVDLQELDCANSQVADLAPLAGLTNLTTLNLVVTKVNDLSPLMGLKKLELLYLYTTDVSVKQIEVLEAALPKLDVDY